MIRSYRHGNDLSYDIEMLDIVFPLPVVHMESLPHGPS
jgi:hypothetical protein